MSRRARSFGPCVPAAAARVCAWFVLLASIASCSTQGTGELLCANHADDDGDGNIDCLDPDCHASEACRDFIDVIQPAIDAGDQTGTGSEPPPPLDSGASSPPPDAGPILVPEDAGAIVTPPDPDAAPPPECPVCLPTEMCELDACVPVAVMESGHYSLRVISAGAPDMNAASRCYDYVCNSPLLSPPYGFCTCPPDTYVRTVRLRGSEVMEVGVTAVKEDEHAAVFDDPPFDLQLEPGDVLRFEIWDDDTGNTDTMLYECKPDLTTLAPGLISCSANGGVFNLQILTVKAELTTEVQ